MFMKRPNHRVFDYPARFYKPETDEKEKRKKKLGFSAQRKVDKEEKKSVYLGDIYNNCGFCLFEIISSNLRTIIISLHNIHYRTFTIVIN